MALRSNQVKYFPMELVNFVKGLTEVMDFTREVLIERSGPLVQSGQILPHGAGKLCEGSDGVNNNSHKVLYIISRQK